MLGWGRSWGAQLVASQRRKPHRSLLRVRCPQLEDLPRRHRLQPAGITGSGNSLRGQGVRLHTEVMLVKAAHVYGKFVVHYWVD